MVMETLGQALARTLNEFGIGGHILGCDADPTEITVYRPIYDTEGRICFANGTTEAAVVEETFLMNHMRRREHND